MANDAWFPFYIGDYLKKANHLSQGEHGAFTLLLMFYYGKSRPIPVSKCYAIAYAHAEQERCNVDAVLSEFFYLDGDVWRNKRADKEVAKRSDIGEKRQKAANARWEKEHANADASALHMDTQPHPHPQSHPQPPAQTQQHKEPDIGKGGVGEKQGKGSLNPSDENKVGYRWDIRQILSPATLDVAKRLSEEWGWDFNRLCEIYNEWVKENGYPTHPEKAFIPWMRRFTGEGPPS